MKKVYETTGDTEHFSHYECSKCETIFRLSWPRVGAKEVRANYCGKCGHRFVGREI